MLVQMDTPIELQSALCAIIISIFPERDDSHLRVLSKSSDR